MEADAIKPLLSALAAGRTLTEAEAYAAFEEVMSGRATEAQIAALLTATAARPGGPTVDEITGAARAMHAHVTPIAVPEGVEVIDTCGTGGDASGTFNISTAAALIAAGAGAVVAKHGNRSVTSKSGSSQVLEALGVKLMVDGATLTRCLAEAGICFAYAPAHHPAMKHAAPVRQQLGFRTVFNLLGPLTNPAGAARQVIGVFEAALTEPIATALQRLGAVRAMVVHGDGLDEIATTGPTRITTLANGAIRTTELRADDLGIETASIEALRVESVAASASVIRAVLEGEHGAARDIAALNAAAALVVADRAADLAEGLAHAGNAIDAGAARDTLERLIAITNES